VKATLFLTAIVLILIFTAYGILLRTWLGAMGSSNPRDLLSCIQFYIFIFGNFSLLLVIVGYASILIRKKRPLQIEVINIILESGCYPVLEIRIKNNGKMALQVKHIEFKVLKCWVVKKPIRTTRNLMDWAYDIDLPYLGNCKRFSIAREIRPNSVDVLQLKVKGDCYTTDGLTLHWLKCKFIYDEVNLETNEMEILLNIPDAIEPSDCYRNHNATHLLEKNKKAAIEILEIIKNNKQIIYHPEYVKELEYWKNAEHLWEPRKSD